MDEYSFISENGNIRQIRDLIAKEKDEQQDAAINEINSKINGLSHYRTLETQIGTWIDLKPIYRKVILFDSERDISNSGTNFTLAGLGLSNIDNILKVHGFNTTGTKVTKRRSAPMGVYWISDTTIQLRTISQLTSYYLGLIIEYTKTTD